LAGWPAVSLARRFSVEFQRFLIMLSVLRAGRSAGSRSAGAPAVPRTGRGSWAARPWKAGWRGEQGSAPADPPLTVWAAQCALPGRTFQASA